MEGIRQKWGLSKPEFVDCEKWGSVFGNGTLVVAMRDSGRWMATQENYTIDLLARVLGPEPQEWVRRKTPMSKEPDVGADAQVTPEAMKRAQECVGELVWLSTKCRPDISYPVS